MPSPAQEVNKKGDVKGSTAGVIFSWRSKLNHRDRDHDCDSRLGLCDSCVKLYFPLSVALARGRTTVPFVRPRTTENNDSMHRTYGTHKILHQLRLPTTISFHKPWFSPGSRFNPVVSNFLSFCTAGIASSGAMMKIDFADQVMPVCVLENCWRTVTTRPDLQGKARCALILPISTGLPLTHDTE